MAALGELIEREMRRRDINQTEAATEMGVSPSLVNRWVRGKMAPSIESCAGIAAFLHMEVSDVLTLGGYESLGEQVGRRDATPVDPEMRLALREVQTLLESCDRSRWESVTTAIRGLVGLVSPLNTESDPRLNPVATLDKQTESGSGKNITNTIVPKVLARASS